MNDPKELEALAKTARGFSVHATGEFQAFFDDVATALDAYGRILAANTDTRGIEREHERVAQTYDSQGLSGGEANEAHRNRATLLGIVRKIEVENTQLIEAAISMLDEIEMRRAKDDKSECGWCGAIALRVETTAHVKVCEKNPARIDLSKIRATLLSCYDTRSAPESLDTPDLAELVKGDLRLVRQTSQRRAERLAECQRKLIATEAIIARAKDLRRRANELDEEFNHDEGSTVENALAYVLGDEPAESCIILQMHIDAAGN